MSRKHVPWLAVVILLISVGDARAQRGGAHHGAIGGHHGGAGGFQHPGHWGVGWGAAYPVYGYAGWDTGWYGMGYDYGMTGLGNLYAGEGAYLQGTGEFLLNSAMAEEIAARTAIMANQYVYQAQREANRRYALRKVVQHQHLAAMRRGMQERLVFDPTERDITVGDALNAAAEVVSRHKPFRLDPGQLSAAIPARWLADLTFSLPAANVRINLDGLANADLMTSPPRTLGTLIGFMTAHNLRFGPAQTARQRTAHQDFYPILADALRKALAASRNGDERMAMRGAGNQAGRAE